MGMALVETGQYKTAIEHYANVIKARPKNVKGWSAILECMLKADMLENADEYALAAYEATGEKPVFLFYRVAISFAQSMSKQAITQLEYAMSKAPKLIKKLIEVQPKLLQHPQVVDLIARYKRSNSL
jgi:tetratricopeptide (TPR) repeat protein